nr:hypothetical protein BDOA9_0153220 [Bradyrhizobium sp. DOA9]
MSNSSYSSGGSWGPPPNAGTTFSASATAPVSGEQAAYSAEPSSTEQPLDMTNNLQLPHNHTCADSGNLRVGKLGHGARDHLGNAGRNSALVLGIDNPAINA